MFVFELTFVGSLSFLGQFSHDTIIVATSITFLNGLKSSCLVLFWWRKMQKVKKLAMRKILYLISPQWEHFRTWFTQIQEDTVQGYNFCFWLFLVTGHVTVIPISHWMNPDKQNHHYLDFLDILLIQDHISFLGVYVVNSDMDPEGSAS